MQLRICTISGKTEYFHYKSISKAIGEPIAKELNQYGTETYFLLALVNIRSHLKPLERLPFFVDSQINSGFPTM